MPVRVIECPNCGADLDDYKPGSRFACAYCGTTVVAPPENAWAPPAVPAPRVVATPPVSVDPAKVRRIAVLGMLVPLLLSVGIGAFTYFQVDDAQKRAKEAVNRAFGGKGADNPALPSALRVAPEERFGWDDVGGRPIPVTIGGQAAVVGRTRAYNDDDTLFIDAYAADDARRLWRVNSGSNYSSAYRNVHVVVVGEFVVLSDLAGNLHVHALETGERLRSAPMSERVKDLCMPSRGTGPKPEPARVWVQLADERALLFDPSTGKSEAAKRPAWCEQTRNEGRRGQVRKRRGQPSPKGSAKQLGLNINATHFDRSAKGKVAVAVGHKHPGTKIPRALGFDLKTGEVQWQVDVPSVDMGAVRMGSAKASAFDDGRLAVVYGEGSEHWRFAGFDASDGTRLFDARMPSIFAVDLVDWMTIADGYAYIERTGGLEVRRMRDGSLAGMIGTLTYDDDLP